MEDIELIEKRIAFYTEQAELINRLLAAINVRVVDSLDDVECGRLRIEESKLKFELAAKEMYVSAFYKNIEESKAHADENEGYMKEHISSLIKTSEELVKNIVIPQEHRDRMKGYQLQYYSIWNESDNFQRSKIFFPLKQTIDRCLSSLRKS